MSEETVVVTPAAAEAPPVNANVHLLPRNLAGLVKLASKDAGRFATAGVRLSVSGDAYTAEATDCRVLGRVTGTAEDSAQYPALPSLAAAPNGATSAVIPTKAWTDAFKGLPKHNHVKPILGNVACVLGQFVATLATTDLEREQSAQTRLLDGRFPDAAGCFPRPGTSAKVRLSPELLKRLIDVASAFCPDDTGKIEMEVFTGCGQKDKDGYSTVPVVIRAARPGQEFTGLIMPLS